MTITASGWPIRTAGSRTSSRKKFAIGRPRRYDRGRHNTQFGSPKNPAHFPFLRAYSPQHNVKPGACYPATLITTALNDDRAPAWMALKLTAALQAAQSCERPIVLRADTSGGHIASSLDDGADVMAFVVGQLGLR